MCGCVIYYTKWAQPDGQQGDPIKVEEVGEVIWLAAGLFTI